MSVFERYLDARQHWIDEHRTLPGRVYVSPATAARVTHEASALRTQDVPTITRSGVMGYVGGCDWHVDPTMGDGFRFEMGES